MQALFLVLALGQAEPPKDLGAARERERVARLELQAAKSKEFYFIAEASLLTLSLKLAGVPLASYQLDSVEIGRTLASSGESLVLEDLYRCTSPPREPVEIVPGPPPAPPAPGEEEKKTAKVPRSAVLSCEPPLAVHLVSAGKVLGFRERLRLSSDRKDEPRVRLLVSEADAERLFTSLPETPLILFSRAPRTEPGPATR
jgi:hypothetical protein